MLESKSTPPGAESFVSEKNEISTELKEVDGIGIVTNGKKVKNLASGETRTMPASYPESAIGNYFENGGVLGFVDEKGQMRIENVAGNDSKRTSIISKLKEAGYTMGNLEIPLVANTEKFEDEGLQQTFDAAWY